MSDSPSDRVARRPLDGPASVGPRVRIRQVGLVAVLAVLTGSVMAGTVRAQVGSVVAKEVVVGSSEASLRLELVDRDLAISLHGGVVDIDGREVGRFEAGSTLDTAWRQLLASAVAMDGTALVRALIDWTPPEDLDGPDRELGETIDGALESTLASSTLGDPPRPVDMDGELVRSLLSRSDRLGDLSEVLAGADLDHMILRIDEDVYVAGDEELGTTLLAIDADVDIEGTVRGDLIVLGGTLALGEGGRVTGDVYLAEARLLSNEGVIEGSVSELSSDEVEAADEERRESLRDEIRAEVADQPSERGVSWRLLRPFRAIGRGIGGLLTIGVNVAILGLLGWLLVYFAGDHLAVVAETARRSPGRAAMVGVAGTFLVLPVWLLGTLALVLTIVGIFAVPFWLVLFPIAVVLAACFGFYGAASGIGEHVARWHHPWVQWVRSSNPYTLVSAGLVALAAPFLLASIVEMGLFFGLIEGLLLVAGWLVLASAGLVGFGAVLLTRAGRRPAFHWGGQPDDDPGPWDDGSPSPSGRHDWFGAEAPRGPGEEPGPETS